MRKGLLVVALLASGIPASADDTVVDVLTVCNRPAADLVSVLQPIAGPDGVVTASGDKLVIRARPAALAQLKQALAALDVAPPALWITVRQGGERTMTSRSAEVSGAIRPASRSRTLVTVPTGVDPATMSRDRGPCHESFNEPEKEQVFRRLQAGLEARLASRSS